MTAESPVWMGHAGHFICGRDCGFRLNTYVNGFIVSTVGELKYGSDRDDSPPRPLGADPESLYETMVFEAKASHHECCPWEQANGTELDCRRYATPDDAARGHAEMLAKWGAS